jgi:hypothetical protein
MIILEDPLLVAIEDTNKTADIAEISSLIATATDNTILATYQYADLVAYAADSTTKLAISAAKSLNAVFEITEIKTYVDLASPSVYLRKIRGTHTETWALSSIDTFRFDIVKDVIEPLNMIERANYRVGTSLTDVADLMTDEVLQTIRPTQYEDMSILESVTFYHNKNMFDVANMIDILESVLGTATSDTYIFEMSDSINNVTVKPHITNYLFIEEYIRLHLNKVNTEIADYIDILESTLSTATSDTYIFEMSDNIANIVLNPNTIEQLVIDESFRFDIKRTSFETMSLQAILRPRIELTKYLYLILEESISTKLKSVFTNYVFYLEDLRTRLTVTLSDSYTFDESIPTYVQRFYEDLPAFDSLENIVLDMPQANTLGMLSQLYSYFATTVKDLITYGFNDTISLRLKRTQTDPINYQDTISGYIDDYFLPDYCDLGYAGIPI